MTAAEVRDLARELLAERGFRAQLADAMAVEAGRLAYSVDETATRMGCGRDLIYGELAAGRLASWHVGARRFIRREELQRYTEEREAAERDAA